MPCCFFKAALLERSGSSAASTCSQCQAGTYGTGSGQSLSQSRTRFIHVHPLHIMPGTDSGCTQHKAVSSLDTCSTIRDPADAGHKANSLWAETDGHAGATADFNCSLCRAGTFLTGSGLRANIISTQGPA